MFSRLHLVVIVVLFLFALCVVARHVTYLFSAAGGVVVACWFFGFFGCVVLFFGCLWLPPCVRCFIPSPFPFMPLHTMLLFRSDDGLVVLVVTGIRFVPYVCGVRRWAWSLGYTPRFSSLARLQSRFP